MKYTEVRLGDAVQLRHLFLFFIFLEIGMLENKFKTKLIKEIKQRFPGCLVVHLDPNEIQGIPDLLILFNDKWAALEGKKNASASHRPNQDYYVAMMDRMSFARFIFPENAQEVMNDLERTFKT